MTKIKNFEEFLKEIYKSLPENRFFLDENYEEKVKKAEIYENKKIIDFINNFNALFVSAPTIFFGASKKSSAWPAGGVSTTILS